MGKIILTTESGADLSLELCEKHHILTVPFGLNFPDRTVNDGEIPVQEIYDFYRETRSIPKTNAVSPYQYAEFFRAAAEQDPGCEIVHIGYSSACSCSFQNAVLGVRVLQGIKVHLVDSLNVSGGLGNLVLRAAGALEENPEIRLEELVTEISSCVKKIRTAFVPDTLEFLLAGGRVSNAAAIGAAILKIKPRIDIIDGKLIAGKKYRGRMEKVAFRFLDDFLEGKNFDRGRIDLFYAEGADLHLMEQVHRYLEDRGFERVRVGVLGCVMTVHGGRGAIGLSAMEL